ncbi:MAG: polysaccharide biosynthesis/export family protein [Flavobacteriales bacterium]|jgi:polysaccharide export outer membrane protein|nr:polysaccharide biosynthesis/export family protein [Flavobacteriales bacterium]
MRTLFILLSLSVFFITSCSVNSHVLLKTPRDFVFDTPPEKPQEEYVISPNDILKFKLYSNDGFIIIDLASGAKSNNSSFAQTIKYTVDYQGITSLPIIGDIKISGYTIREAITMLEEKYADFYVDPFIQLEVINKRVVVFPGTGSGAKVLTLENNSTKLIEVLGYVGGISEKGKAARIKVLRETKEKREIYLIDLSTIDGIKDADMIVQANDIIYVEPVPNIAQEVLSDVTPVVSLVSSALVIWISLRTISN